MTPDDQERARAFLGTIARRHGPVGATGAAVHESVAAPFSLDDLADGAMPPPDDVVDFVDAQLSRVPRDQVEDLDAFERAKAVLLRESRRSLRKAREEGFRAEFSSDEIGAFEGVVEVDGSRPSLLLRGGRADHRHPLAGTWAEDIGSTGDTIAQIAAAVGRIEPTRGSPSRYFGTGFVVDAAKGLVLTNRHVLEAMFRNLREFIDVRDGRMTFVDGAFIDFDGEANTTEAKRFRVIEAAHVGPDGREFERLDAALLRIRPLDARERVREPRAPFELPAAVDLNFEIAGATGARGSFAVVGFPGRVPAPSERGEADAGVDWDWVSRTLMGGYQGVKRLAPGVVDEPVGRLASDTRRWCFGHDATTLQGSSGSACVLWKDVDKQVFGLHFAGWTHHVNYAHAIGCIQEHLETARSSFR